MVKTSSVSLSREGFPSHVWGPGLWKIIHMIALNVRLHPTLEEKQGYENFFKSLQYVLPCGTCRKEYTKLMRPKSPHRITPGTFNDRATAFAWTVRLHYAVSRRLKKILSTDIDWAAHYESARHDPAPPAPIRMKGKGKILVEFHPLGAEDGKRVRATLGHVHQGRVALRATRKLSPGLFRVRNRVFPNLSDVLRVLSP